MARPDEEKGRWEGWVQYRLRDDTRRDWIAGDRLHPFPGHEVQDWLPVTRTV